MKKFLSTLLVGAMFLSLIPAFAVSAAESATLTTETAYEAENAVYTGELRTSDEGVSSIWGLDNEVEGGLNATVTYTLNAAEAGEYDLALAVICGDVRNIRATVNGTSYDLQVAGTGSWGTGAGVTSVEAMVKSVSIIAGENTIVISGTPGYYGPGIDYIKFYEVVPPTEYDLVAGETLKIEAEAASIINATTAADSAPASGGKHVGLGGEGGAADKYIEFIVNAPVAGEANLVIYYFCADTRNLEMSVNGGEATVLAFANNGTWGNAEDGPATAHDTVVLTLNEGENTIRLYNSTAWGPNVDFIELTMAAAGGEDVGGGEGTGNEGNEGGQTPVPTGDATALALAISTIALVGTAVVVSKKRHAAE